MRVRRFEVVDTSSFKLFITNKHGVIHNAYSKCRAISKIKAEDVVYVTILQFYVYDLPVCYTCLPSGIYRKGRIKHD